MPISLTGRLLCAAQQTYEIKVSGPAPVPPPAPAPPSLVGWIGAPQCFVASVAQITAVLVGETASEIIVAFRGTEPFDSLDHFQMILDWLDDLDAALVQIPGFPGLVHQGFSAGILQLWPWVQAQVATLTQASPGKPLYVVGHSKGGALANLNAIQLVSAGDKSFVCTFEAARCGDQDFANGYGKVVNYATRYEYQDDIVPHLPPTEAFFAMFDSVDFLSARLRLMTHGYVSVGDLRFINWQNQIVGDSPALEAERYFLLITLMLSFGAGKIIADHSIGPGSGVAGVLCPGIWPPAIALAA
jgi:hypothetical protein